MYLVHLIKINQILLMGINTFQNKMIEIGILLITEAVKTQAEGLRG